MRILPRHGGAGSVLAVAACIVAVGAASAAIVTRTADKSPAMNSNESGLSDAQRNALYQANNGQFDTKLKAWYAHLDPKALDLQHLHRSGMMATFAPPDASTLRDAIAGASAIVTGLVTDIRTSPGYVGMLPESYVTVRVESVIKGSASRSIVIHQLGGIVPSLDWTRAEVEDADPAPLLLPGDRALLVLKQDSVTAGAWVLESYTGLYKITSAGIVSAVSGNPFASQVSGMPITAVETLFATVSSTG